MLTFEVITVLEGQITKMVPTFRWPEKYLQDRLKLRTQARYLQL